jgi:hypothetical protein
MSRVLLGSPREAMPLDLLQAEANEGLIAEALKGLFPEERITALLTPSNELAEFLYGFCATEQGRVIFEWLMDITLRAPYRVTGASLEQTALNAARREGLNLAGEMILAAIARGQQSVAARNPGARQ